VVEHHGRPRVWSDLDDVMDISRSARTDPLQHDWRGDVGTGIHLYVQPVGGALHGKSADPVGRNERRAEGTER
jgi:hypothetical protein